GEIAAEGDALPGHFGEGMGGPGAGELGDQVLLLAQLGAGELVELFRPVDVIGQVLLGTDFEAAGEESAAALDELRGDKEKVPGFSLGTEGIGELEQGRRLDRLPPGLKQVVLLQIIQQEIPPPDRPAEVITGRPAEKRGKVIVAEDGI
ncbi:MAG: hypothetical protein NTV79_02360, partial [Candidatus Aureabacteria bacterium]|nr:hypothetical protein [Candidatus Auribacterota bacterium]